MADEKTNYPQIPNRVWWEVRKMLQSRPNAKVTEALLATKLSVQPSAAKAYIGNFKTVGLLDEEGGATKIAHKWRLDDSYEEAKSEILRYAYPDELVDNFPENEADAAQVANWFELGGLGTGTAKNKSATYVLIANSNPADGENLSAPRQQSSGDKAKKSAKSEKTNGKPSRANRSKTDGFPETLDMNVNLQIHISADASNEQIETIFASMRKYLYS